jgi:hypothetical protein
MNGTAFLLITAYLIGLAAFVLVGALEWAMSAAEIRRIDRDPWSRGEPWQRDHQHAALDRERASIDHAATILTYSAVWPLLVAGVLVRSITRHRKEHPAHEPPE